MRHLHHLPRYHQQLLYLEVLRIYTPLAHALSLPLLSLELEDLAFRSLFPYSCLYVDAWLRSHPTVHNVGLTDPREVKRLKAIMMAAAELAVLCLQDLPSASHKGVEVDQRDTVFRLLHKNGDGRISIEELMEVMEELGAPGRDARETTQLLDSNSDGSLSSKEFDLFQKQMDILISSFLTMKVTMAQ